jgi:hypothetical protein
MQVSIEAAAQRLRASEGKTFLEIFRHGSMSLEIYQPRGHDPQKMNDE